MKLRFCSLASGSSGNSYLVRTDSTAVLVDAGISGKKIQTGLEENGAREIISGLLLTHEHVDHVKSVSTLAKRLPQMAVYATQGTWENMEHTVSAEQQKVLGEGEVLTIGDLEVRVFGLSHDAAQPVGYTFRYEGKQITIVTDTGCYSEEILREAEDADLLVLEANHDVDMLRIGRYPWFLKQRVLSDVGHLSNEEAGKCLVELLQRKEKDRVVCLAHLSRENNFPEMAYQTVKNILEDADYYIGKQVQLITLDREGISGMYEL
ncbi:MAG: MBL fold metallo-hydrolase [Firmicutes bacterium]|nr:MBL fold metallo-hydrolase [Bacillota bacterium]